MSALFGIGLYRAKTRDNIGGVVRSLGCFGGSFLYLEGIRYTQQVTDCMKMTRQFPVSYVPDLLEAAPHSCVPVAVEVSGKTSLPRFTHPPNAYYIFGPEDGSLGDELLRRCPYSVVIPTKFCLNLASATTVVLYDRIAKGEDSNG